MNATRRRRAGMAARQRAGVRLGGRRGTQRLATGLGGDRARHPGHRRANGLSCDCVVACAVADAACRGSQPRGLRRGCAVRGDHRPGLLRAGHRQPGLPLVPGTTTIFDGEGEHIVVEVTGYTKMVMGVPVTVVRHTAYAKGKVIEDSSTPTRRIAPALSGTSARRPPLSRTETDHHGRLLGGRRRRWTARHRDARPAQVGDVYRNEYGAGEAEDLSKVLEIGGTITVPAGTFNDTILTGDWTPLEPDQLEHKTMRRASAWSPKARSKTSSSASSPRPPARRSRGHGQRRKARSGGDADADLGGDLLALTAARSAAWSRSVWSA